MAHFKSQEDNANSFNVNMQESNFMLNQDVSAYLKYAKESRDKYEYYKGTEKTHYRSFAIIPDIVAIDILKKYNIDIHASEFMSDKQLVSKLRKIIIDEYPGLLTHGHSRRS